MKIEDLKVELNVVGQETAQIESGVTQDVVKKLLSEAERREAEANANGEANVDAKGNKKRQREAKLPKLKIYGGADNDTVNGGKTFKVRVANPTGLI